MRKRIRIHQLQVGMFVEEVETAGSQPTPRVGPFMISSSHEVARMMNSNVMTVVIDVQKGVDVGQVQSPRPFNRREFDAHLLEKATARDIERAKRCIADTKPHIREILLEARIKGAFAARAATTAVEKIMVSAMDNAGALIAVAKLKERDETTFLHSLAVSALMIAFGRSLGHAEDDVHLLGIGGLVHDLGKMVLPTAILTKSGKLTADEMNVVRHHPQRGFELVSRLNNPPQQVLDICLYHHEKFDGSGYPRGIQGTEIPYVARLAAICDVYEALTTVRPYKRAWSQAEAINMMMNSPGHFDTNLLSAFVSKMVINGTLH
ncbi:HD-GYP domain-containing protein (plasmid) [Rhizobium sp. 32-5/1]|uniref:HD-GYP domain-containing protein n=1 Tax=Rhizobium sp. 32-5/1 TaxID=3019602 RepID=UPI00240D4ACE|nr:HD-GYP domain-containing protein [Rhizobium sp. 32-5/1]WEZ85701.1 HD-GYP domain-containing protein [Rhizobium sp. 32-5/1]